MHRTEISEDYKAERRPMPDLLREQFPYFRPIVEAFGYRNLEFEGWEADDVIATLATRADEAGIKTRVVSTDRDAFQLVSENVCLMMTPRGVSDVHVYTPERVEARYGIPPDQVPDFIGLKGDTSDNIAGVPGIGDKTAGQLIAQYGSLEDVARARRRAVSGARAKNITEHADQARQSKLLATMRRDLELDCDPTRARPRPARPLGAEGDVPALRVPQPAAAASTSSTTRFPPRRWQSSGVEVPWREELATACCKVGVASPMRRTTERGRAGRAEVVVASRAVDANWTARFVVHDAKAARRRRGATTRCCSRT